MEERNKREPAVGQAPILRKFSEKPVRDAKANQTVFLLMAVMEVPIMVVLVRQFMSAEVSYGKAAAVPMAILLAGVIVGLAVYLKDKSSEPLRYIMLGTFLAGWGYIMVTEQGILTCTYIFPMMIALILYYDRKFEKRAFAGILAFIVLRGIVLAVSGSLWGDELMLASFCTGALVVLSYNVTARTAKNFDHDTIWSVKDEQAKQNRMMDDILRISEAVKAEVGHTDALVENLRNSSQVVHSSIQEISVSTQVTAESVQEQTTMTSRIKDAIEETAENAKIMVEAAEASMHMVDDSMDMVNQMRESAKTIGETNAHVAESMSQLQEKAKEVEQITEVIFEISSQTNLLALNASIESARAGEAGKGFAVVAEEVRSLASKSSVASKNTAELIESSIDAVARGTKIANSTAESLMKVVEEVRSASGKVDAIANAAEEQSGAIEQVTLGVDQISSVVQLRYGRRKCCRQPGAFGTGRHAEIPCGEVQSPRGICAGYCQYQCE